MGAAQPVQLSGYERAFNFAQKSATYVGGAGWAIFNETANWIAQIGGTKNLVGRTLSIIPEWAAYGGITLSPSLVRICAVGAQAKALLSALEMITKFPANVIADPKDKKKYMVIEEGTGERQLAFVIRTNPEQQLRKFGDFASWAFSAMDFTFFIRDTSLLNLGQKGVTRLSWAASTIGVLASIQGIVEESLFLYKAKNAKTHDFSQKSETAKKPVEKLNQSGKLLASEGVNSMIKIAQNIAGLVLSVCYALPLMNYRSETIRLVRLTSVTAFTTLAIVGHYWDRLVVGARVPSWSKTIPDMRK